MTHRLHSLRIGITVVVILSCKINLVKPLAHTTIKTKHPSSNYNFSELLFKFFSVLMLIRLALIWLYIFLGNLTYCFTNQVTILEEIELIEDWRWCGKSQSLKSLKCQWLHMLNIVQRITLFWATCLHKCCENYFRLCPRRWPYFLQNFPFLLSSPHPSPQML